MGDLMGIRLTVDPNKSLATFIETKKKLAPAALLAAGLTLEATTKETLSQPGHGAIRRSGRERVGAGSFNRGKDGKLHLVTRGAARTNIDVTDRASLPGEPPAPDTGALRASIAHEVVDPLTVRVGTNLEYAPPLEFGTTRMAPRPFMRPSLAKARGQMSDEVIAVLGE